MHGVAAGYTLKQTQAGNVIQWHADAVRYYVDPTLSYLDAEAVTQAVVAGFEVWAQVSTARLDLEYAGQRVGQREGFERDGENVNVVRFEEARFPYDDSVLAVTLLTYDSAQGTMLDADVVFNAVSHRFTTDNTGTPGLHDIQNTMAHEAGHFVGLAHEPGDETATMYPVASPGETGKRTLGRDDQNGMTFLYPAPNLSPSDIPAPSVDPNAPGAGGSPESSNETVSLDRVEIGLGCSQSGSSTGNPAALLALMALAAGALHRRRRQ